MNSTHIKNLIIFFFDKTPIKGLIKISSTRNVMHPNTKVMIYDFNIN